ncbi:DUF397 domain-containing protein [Phytohabitans suffuscus]|uniref:DUF397 domain-containing protein n=1 Tax=Phytohabitans suffuscus TaxID=624315 RepID=UPI0038CD6921
MLTSEWKVSSRSVENGMCVQVRLARGFVEVRDSKSSGNETLQFGKISWKIFLNGLKK